MSRIYSDNGLLLGCSVAELLAMPGLNPDPAVSEDQQIISFAGRLHFTCLPGCSQADLGSLSLMAISSAPPSLPSPPWQLYWGVVIEVISVIGLRMC